MVADKQARDVVTRQYNEAQNEVTHDGNKQHGTCFGPFYRGHQERKYGDKYQKEEQTGIEIQFLFSHFAERLFYFPAQLVF